MNKYESLDIETIWYNDVDKTHSIMNKFVYSERLFETENWNLINYYAGPIKISICGLNEEIKIEADEIWQKLLTECIETIKEAWKIEEKQIKIEKNSIKLNTISKTLNYT